MLDCIFSEQVQSGKTYEGNDDYGGMIKVKVFMMDRGGLR
jgi:hypothetical protein